MINVDPQLVKRRSEELRRMEEAEAARREQEKLAGKTKDSQELFKAV